MNLLIHGKGRLDEEMQIAEICHYMGWDYHTFQSQPLWFIDAISLKKNLDAHYHNQKQKQREAELRHK